MCALHYIFGCGHCNANIWLHCIAYIWMGAVQCIYLVVLIAYIWSEMLCSAYLGAVQCIYLVANAVQCILVFVLKQHRVNIWFVVRLSEGAFNRMRLVGVSWGLVKRDQSGSDGIAHTGDAVGAVDDVDPLFN